MMATADNRAYLASVFRTSAQIRFQRTSDTLIPLHEILGRCSLKKKTILMKHICHVLSVLIDLLNAGRRKKLVISRCSLKRV